MTTATAVTRSAALAGATASRQLASAGATYPPYAALAGRVQMANTGKSPLVANSYWQSPELDPYVRAAVQSKTDFTEEGHYFQVLAPCHLMCIMQSRWSMGAPSLSSFFTAFSISNGRGGSFQDGTLGFDSNSGTGIFNGMSFRSGVTTGLSFTRTLQVVSGIVNVFPWLIMGNNNSSVSWRATVILLQNATQRYLPNV